MHRTSTILVLTVLMSLAGICRGEDSLEQRLAKLQVASAAPAAPAPTPAPAPAPKQEPNQPADSLSTKVQTMEKELDALRAELAKVKTDAAQQPTPAAGPGPEDISKMVDKALAEKKTATVELPDWVKKIKLTGDLRYRYENIDDDSKTSERDRNRIRARLGLTAKVNDEWNLGFRMATSEGIQAGDPISTNQTLGGSWGKRPFWLDQAFLNYQPQWAKGVDVFAGKIEMPFYRPAKNQLIWDSDLTPEGGALLYNLALGEKTSLNLATGGFWVVERSTDIDTSLLGAQGYLKQKIGGPTYVLGGVSGYWFGHIQGQQALSLQWESPTSAFFGNSSAGGLFASEYELLELFGEIGTEIAKVPVMVFGDYVVNTAALHEGQDTGWMVGASINKAKDPGSWQLDYDYREVQADAVVGQFTDSDFIGGGTGGRGHRFGFSYVLTKNVVPGLGYYINRYDGRNDNADYKRLQADVVVKF